jgi:hypothetical protein
MVLALAACGRLGFDESSGDDTGDAPVGDVVPNICNGRMAGALSLNGTETPVKMRATQLANGGYAVAVETTDANVYVLRLDANGAVVSQHAPMNAGYTLHGISQINDRPFVYVFTSGAGYIKMLEPDWNSYTTGPSGEQFTLDPQQALLPGGATAMYGVIAGGTMSITSIDMTGVTGVGADYAPAATRGSFAKMPSGVRVVASNAGGCETFAIAPSGTTGMRDAFGPCEEPVIAMVDDQRGAILYKDATNGSLAVYTLPDKAKTTLEPGTNPRIAVFDGAIWVAYLAQNALRIRRFDGIAPPTQQDFPAIPVFDLLPTAAFWVDTDGVHAADPCR